MSGGHAEGAQDRQFPRTFQLQCQHRAENADDGDADGKPVQDVGDDKCTIKDLQREISQVTIGSHQSRLFTFARTLQVKHHRINVGAALQVNSKSVDCLVVPVLQVGCATHKYGPGTSVVALVGRCNLEWLATRSSHQNESIAAAKAMPISERLRHKHGLLFVKLPPGLNGIGVKNRGGGITACCHFLGDDARASLRRFKPGPMSRAIFCNTRNACQILDKFRIQASMRYTDIDIRLQRLTNPFADCAAKAIDHHCHADGCGYGHRQRYDSDSRPAQGCANAGNGQTC